MDSEVAMCKSSACWDEGCLRPLRKLPLSDGELVDDEEEDSAECEGESPNEERELQRFDSSSSMAALLRFEFGAVTASGPLMPLVAMLLDQFHLL